MTGRSEARVLDGQTAWVLGGDDSLGRAVAVELASRGATLWVLGQNERALGEAVGEIAYQGGKARHLVLGDAGCSLSEAIAGREVAPEIVVIVVTATSAGEADVARLDHDVAIALGDGGRGQRLLLVGTGRLSAALRGWVQAKTRRGILRGGEQPVFLVTMEGSRGDEAAAARLAALLLGPEGGRLAGQVIVVASE